MACAQYEAIRLQLNQIKMKDNLNHEESEFGIPQAQLDRAREFMDALYDELLNRLSKQPKSHTAAIMAEFSKYVWDRIVQGQEQEFGPITKVSFALIFKYAKTMEMVYKRLSNEAMTQAAMDRIMHYVDTSDESGT